MDFKKIAGLFKSRTFYFNVIMGLVALFQASAAQEGVTIDPALIGGITAVGNFGMRYITTTSLADK
jgi:hypothetical protein